MPETSLPSLHQGARQASYWLCLRPFAPYPTHPMLGFVYPILHVPVLAKRRDRSAWVNSSAANGTPGRAHQSPSRLATTWQLATKVGTWPICPLVWPRRPPVGEAERERERESELAEVVVRCVQPGTSPHSSLPLGSTSRHSDRLPGPVAITP
ncbi:hypothetical protein GQ53DRAFT_17278 [Thozetella sp. PMI_491]|nr:hypothetical protein GQ53DRAFT_17278 [Thozetella sp. PMI_491]